MYVTEYWMKVVACYSTKKATKMVIEGDNDREKRGVAVISNWVSLMVKD